MKLRSSRMIGIGSMSSTMMAPPVVDTFTGRHSSQREESAKTATTANEPQNLQASCPNVKFSPLLRQVSCGDGEVLPLLQQVSSELSLLPQQGMADDGDFLPLLQQVGMSPEVLVSPLPQQCVAEDESAFSLSSSQELSYDILRILLEKERSRAYGLQFDPSDDPSRLPTTHDCYMSVPSKETEGVRRDEVAKYLTDVVNYEYLRESLEVAEVAMSLLDRFLLTVQLKEGKGRVLSAAFIWLHAFACLAIAIKLFSDSGGSKPSLTPEGEVRLFLKDVWQLLGLDTASIEKAELRIMLELDYKLQPPTSYAFLQHFLALAEPDPYSQQEEVDARGDGQPLHDICSRALIQLELLVVEYGQDCVFKPSVVAQTAIENAIKLSLIEATTRQDHKSVVRITAIEEAIREGCAGLAMARTDDYHFLRSFLYCKLRDLRDDEIMKVAAAALHLHPSTPNPTPGKGGAASASSVSPVCVSGVCLSEADEQSALEMIDNIDSNSFGAQEHEAHADEESTFKMMHLDEGVFPNPQNTYTLVG